MRDTGLPPLLALIVVSVPVYGAQRPIAEVVSDIRSPSADTYTRAITEAASFGPMIIPSLLHEMKTTASADDDIFYRSARVIRSFGGKAVPALKAGLQDPTSAVRRGSAQAVAELGKEALALRSDLIRLLKDEDPMARYFAAASLGNIGPEAKAAIPLYELVGRERCQSYIAAQAIVSLGGQGEEGYEVLGNLLLNDEESCRSGAAEAFSKMGEVGLRYALSLQVADENNRYREVSRVIEKSGAILPTESGRFLRQMIKSEVPELRARAAFLIGRIGAEKTGCEDAIEAALRDPAIWVRQEATRAIGSIRLASPRAVDRLIGLLEVSDLQMHAVLALKDMQGLATPAVPALVQLLDRGRGNHSTYVVEALGSIGANAAPAIPTILRLIQSDSEKMDSPDENFRVRSSFHTISKIKGPAADVVPTLIKFLGHQEEVVRENSARILGEYGSSAIGAERALALVAKDTNFFAACWAKVGLKRIDTPLAREVLRGVPDGVPEIARCSRPPR